MDGAPDGASYFAENTSRLSALAPRHHAMQELAKVRHSDYQTGTS